MIKPVIHWRKGWIIEYNPKPIPDRRNDFDYWKDGYVDLDSPWQGTASSPEDACNQIDEIEAEHND